MRQQLENVVGRSVSRETFERLEAFSALLREENQRQNLVAASTLDDLWQRHIADSAQLVRAAGLASTGCWIDVGSGAGLPGIPVAILTGSPMTLVEPRRLRADFLVRAVRALALENQVEVYQRPIEKVEGAWGVVTARAVAALDKLLSLTHHLRRNGTIWVLPKGKNALVELEAARGNWQYDIEIVPSMTDAEAKILVLANVGARIP